MDAIQAYGKYVIRPKNGALTCFPSAAIRSTDRKGVGFLYIRNGVKIKPLIYGGGGQEAGMRSGTENVPGVAGFGAAAKEMYTNHGKGTEAH